MTNLSAAMPDTLQPTYVGFVQTSRDVCLLLEMVLSGRLPHVPRRPHERERVDIVRSGNIFIYEEQASGVKRWTDGINWSPSRILGNFLIYREMDQSFPAEGGKKTALKKNRASSGSKPTGVKKTRSPNTMSATPYTYGQPGGYGMGENGLATIGDRDLYGSLIDSYPFKESGLVKKTITVVIEGVPHHLVSYYKAADVQSGLLKTPTLDPLFDGIQPRDSLLRNNTFRVPVEQEEFRINENSDAYITQDQVQIKGLYQPQPGYQQRAGMPLQNHGLQNHGLPEHGLPSSQMTGMQPYGQSPFGYTAEPHLQAQAVTQLPSGIQGLTSNNLSAMTGGQYQQPTPQGFPQVQGPYMTNGFQPGPSRHLSYPSTQSSVYAAPPAQSNVYAAPSAQSSVYAPSPAPSYPAQRSYRHASVASAPNGYAPVMPAGTPPNPSPGREIEGVSALEANQGAIGWSMDYFNNGQGFTASDLPLRRDNRTLRRSSRQDFVNRSGPQEDQLNGYFLSPPADADIPSPTGNSWTPPTGTPWTPSTSMISQGSQDRSKFILPSPSGSPTLGNINRMMPQSSASNGPIGPGRVTSSEGFQSLAPNGPIGPVLLADSFMDMLDLDYLNNFVSDPDDGKPDDDGPGTFNGDPWIKF
ncbi:hypothetical protein CONLIGDRAFT_677121 [Coniochaeta ligniaria NRRL 30616]|uniref:Gti1/Pac2 family protein n=1 Tax=Coniochaeta ligniaria NRRL 30616 TaxID=1408157 RepID=A0A1J7J1F9_9PEZI|nr:hypothetical protein CONLIGDRAFT_677121 [Coniochaeta ligniaria NRRL 30616]